MSDRPAVLLTNDDGIDADGLHALRDALSRIADVTVVAPAADRSGAGRTDSRRFTVAERDLGYAVDGTPVDCVHYARGGLERSFDVVVSGCNPGPNLGAHKLGRSGTVGATAEAGYLGIPGIAISLYDPPDGGRAFARREFAEAERVAVYLVEAVVDADSADLRDEFDYLNVNVPVDPSIGQLRITTPVSDFDVRIDSRDDGRDSDGDTDGRNVYSAYDHFYGPLEPSVDVPVTDPIGTDRRAVADCEISVTPLRVRSRPCSLDALSALAGGYGSADD